MAVEVVAGLLAGSLALLSDAAHMLTDAASIALALLAARLAARPAKGAFTFGFGRAEILAAQINGATLFRARRRDRPRGPGSSRSTDLHVWEVTSCFVAVAAHVVVVPDDDCHLRRRELKSVLHDRFGIHTTLQVDHESWQPLVQIEGRS